VSPFIEKRDHTLDDLAFCQEHPQHLVSEYLLQGFDIDGRGYGKHAVFVETFIANQDMQVGMKRKKID
jgi:hypothetical protein